MKMSLNDLQKKETEREHLERFIEVFPDVKTFEVSESEKPDFLLENSEKKIGIEITRIYADMQSSLPQTIENISQQIVTKAKEIYDIQKGEPVEVLVSFGQFGETINKEKNSISEKLANLVSQAQLNLNERISLENDFSNLTDFPEEIDSIRIYKPNYKEVIWTSLQVGFISEISDSLIQGVIDKKNKKIENYSIECDEHWLLLVCGFSISSSFIIKNRKIVEKNYNSKFHNNILLDSFGKKYIELRKN